MHNILEHYQDSYVLYRKFFQELGFNINHEDDFWKNVNMGFGAARFMLDDESNFFIEDHTKDYYNYSKDYGAGLERDKYQFFTYEDMVSVDKYFNGSIPSRQRMSQVDFFTQPRYFEAYLEKAIDLTVRMWREALDFFFDTSNNGGTDNWNLSKATKNMKYLKHHWNLDTGISPQITDGTLKSFVPTNSSGDPDPEKKMFLVPMWYKNYNEELMGEWVHNDSQRIWQFPNPEITEGRWEEGGSRTGRAKIDRPVGIYVKTKNMDDLWPQEVSFEIKDTTGIPDKKIADITSNTPGSNLTVTNDIIRGQFTPQKGMFKDTDWNGDNKEIYFKVTIKYNDDEIDESFSGVLAEIYKPAVTSLKWTKEGQKAQFGETVTLDFRINNVPTIEKNDISIQVFLREIGRDTEVDQSKIQMDGPIINGDNCSVQARVEIDKGLFDGKDREFYAVVSLPGFGKDISVSFESGPKLEVEKPLFRFESWDGGRLIGETAQVTLKLVNCRFLDEGDISDLRVVIKDENTLPDRDVNIKNNVKITHKNKSGNEYEITTEVDLLNDLYKNENLKLYAVVSASINGEKIEEKFDTNGCYHEVRKP
jgi:hypothetical protein